MENLDAEHLQLESLEWALAHINKFGDTDIFPVPFEFAAMKASWPSIKDQLLAIDLAKFQTRSFQRYLVPKPQGGYRVTVQLDPIDLLIYTAVVYEMADTLERSRIPAERKIACSYRIDIGADGKLFDNVHGWAHFQERSHDLANTPGFSHVVTADISDFYNQISHHRIENALESAGIPSNRAKCVERLLGGWTAAQSRGIPVGPRASILLAEIALNDVDTFMLRQGYQYTRYVDDMRIFCRSLSECHRVIHDLSDYLHTSHRLTLQSSKTRPRVLADFIASEFVAPEKLERQNKTEKLQEVIAQVADLTGYDISEEDLDKDELRKIGTDTLVELFTGAVSSSVPATGLAKYLLRRAQKLDTTVLQNHVLDNLEKLLPVFRDAIGYLTKTCPKKVRASLAKELVARANSIDSTFLPYLRLWIVHALLELASKDPDDKDVLNLVESFKHGLGERPAALFARLANTHDWVRQRKETWNVHGPWDRRAVIWAAATLPGDERKHWLKRISDAGDLADKAVALAVLTGL